METQPWKVGLWLTCFLTGAEIVPLSPDRPFGYRVLSRRLRDGGKVGIFPEGGINRTKEALLPLQPGAARLAILCGVPIIPVWIVGMREWIFSPAPAERKRLIPKVTVLIGDPILVKNGHIYDGNY
jgi:1-acyl-sn-glycerol-3-phosphate acyltransferase